MALELGSNLSGLLGASVIKGQALDGGKKSLEFLQVRRCLVAFAGAVKQLGFDNGTEPHARGGSVAKSLDEGRAGTVQEADACVGV